MASHRKKIYKTIEKQNEVVTKGKVNAGTEYLRIDSTGEYTDINKIGDTIISSDKSDRLIRIKDIAKIKREYIDPPDFLMRYNGQKALGIGISTAKGGNVIKLGEAVKEKINSLKATLPVGIKFNIISYESDTVEQSVNGFVVNLIEALVIVIGVLLIFMGIAGGLLIGSILLITILATFIAMKVLGIDIQSISIGALIISLGMLVDNAIVVTEGIQVKIQTGMDRFKAAACSVGETNKSLLGSTCIAILAFAAISLSNDSSGEYCRSMFFVVGIALGFSYLFGITLTPLFYTMLIKSTKSVDDPYSGKFFKKYKSLLRTAINHSKTTIGIIVILFLIAIVCFQFFVGRSFFPDSTRPQFMVDYWLPYGTYIKETSKDMAKIEKFLIKQKNVKNVASFIGGPGLRFLLNYIRKKWIPVMDSL